MKPYLLLLLLTPMYLLAQPQAENHIPYIETSAKADSLVVPDEIYLSIKLREQDERKNVSVEDLEKRMLETLEKLDIDIEKQLKLADLSSNIKTYLLRRKDIKKRKRFELKLKSATTAGRVLEALEEKGIANVSLLKTDYSNIDALKLHLLGEAVAKAKQRANAMANPLGQLVEAAIFISDSNAGFVGYRQNEMVMYSPMVKNASDDAPEIQFKPQKIAVRVTVRFRLGE